MRHGCRISYGANFNAGSSQGADRVQSLPADEAEIAPRQSKAHAPPPPPPEAIIEEPAEPQIVQFVEPEATELEPVIESEPAVFQPDEILQPEPSVENILPPRETGAESQFSETEVEPEIEPAPRPTTPRIIPPKRRRSLETEGM